MMPRRVPPTLTDQDYAAYEARLLAKVSRGLLTPEERRTWYIAWTPGRSGTGAPLALRCARHDSGRWRGVSSLITNMVIKDNDPLYRDEISAKNAARMLYQCAPGL